MGIPFYGKEFAARFTAGRDARGDRRGWEKAGTVREDVERDKLANLIIGSVEGAMLIGRIERMDQPLRDALEHLNEYLEKRVRRVG